MDETGDIHVKRNKPDSQRQVLHVFSHMWYPGKKIKRGIKVKGGWLAKGEVTSGIRQGVRKPEG
jgi:hypothetical protein